MIPKVIHYIWVGGKPLNEMAEKCLASWKKYCPDYEIKRWDETNFDINENTYCREAYENKKWAFVSDYIRLKVLYEEGGVYMDADVELIKPLDNFLEHHAFSGFESENIIPTGIISAEKGNPWIKKMLDHYNDIHFVKPSGKLDLTPNVQFMTKITKKDYKFKLNNEKQDLGDIVFYPKEYFCPKNLYDNKIYLTENTVAIHHFTASWHTPWQRFKKKFKKFLNIITFGLAGKLQQKLKMKIEK